MRSIRCAAPAALLLAHSTAGRRATRSDAGDRLHFDQESFLSVSRAPAVDAVTHPQRSAIPKISPTSTMRCRQEQLNLFQRNEAAVSDQQRRPNVCSLEKIERDYIGLRGACPRD